MVKAKNIRQIYVDIFSKWFRIRDVTTLRDYLVIDFVQWDITCNPVYAYLLSCEDQMHCTADCSINKYALLSSKEELDNMRHFKREAWSRLVIGNYKMVAMKESVQDTLQKVGYHTETGLGKHQMPADH